MCILWQAFEVPCVVRQELLICCDKGASATFQSKPPMGRTSSTTHRWFFHVKATSATLLTRNLFLVISTNLRPQAHCPERRCTHSTPPSTAISTCGQILPLLTRNCFSLSEVGQGQKATESPKSQKSPKGSISPFSLQWYDSCH